MSKLGTGGSPTLCRCRPQPTCTVSKQSRCSYWVTHQDGKTSRWLSLGDSWGNQLFQGSGDAQHPRDEDRIQLWASAKNPSIQDTGDVDHPQGEDCNRLCVFHNYLHSALHAVWLIRDGHLEDILGAVELGKTSSAKEVLGAFQVVQTQSRDSCSCIFQNWLFYAPSSQTLSGWSATSLCWSCSIGKDSWSIWNRFWLPWICVETLIRRSMKSPTLPQQICFLDDYDDDSVHRAEVGLFVDDVLLRWELLWQVFELVIR